MRSAISDLPSPGTWLTGLPCAPTQLPYQWHSTIRYKNISSTKYRSGEAVLPDWQGYSAAWFCYVCLQTCNQHLLNIYDDKTSENRRRQYFRDFRF
jgi:hypothetical protein